jgi:uncharacterized membrane protein
MDTITNYKDRAIASLSGKWGVAAIATLIYLVIFGGIEGTVKYFEMSSFGTIIQILLFPLAWGFTIMFLENIRHEENGMDIGIMFDGFKDYIRILLTSLLMNIYIVLWSLLLVVPGIIKAYSYSMTYYILKDDPDLKYNSAIEKSMRMMEGHKMDLFLLDLSMIGWLFLSIITFGIGFLFLAPYNETAHAHFYEDLKVECQQNIA